MGIVVLCFQGWRMAAASWVRELTPNFGNIRYRCVAIVRWERNMASPISLLVMPSASSLAIWSSWGQLVPPAIGASRTRLSGGA
jgi:hypothetical protein